MTKKILLLVAAFLLSNSFAYAFEYKWAPGINMSFILKPGERQPFTNISFKKMCGVCAVTTEDRNGNSINIEVIKKNGDFKIKRKREDNPNEEYVVVEYSLSKGDQRTVGLYNQDKIYINADAGGQVALTNLGQTEIIALCSNYNCP